MSAKKQEIVEQRTAYTYIIVDIEQIFFEKLRISKKMVRYKSGRICFLFRWYLLYYRISHCYIIQNILFLMQFNYIRIFYCLFTQWSTANSNEAQTLDATQLFKSEKCRFRHNTILEKNSWNWTFPHKKVTYRVSPNEKTEFIFYYVITKEIPCRKNLFFTYKRFRLFRLLCVSS